MPEMKANTIITNLSRMKASIGFLERKMRDDVAIRDARDRPLFPFKNWTKRLSNYTQYLDVRKVTNILIFGLRVYPVKLRII